MGDVNGCVNIEEITPCIAIRSNRAQDKMRSANPLC